MYYVGIDPEFSRSGIAIWDAVLKKLTVQRVCYNGPIKAYEDVVHAVDSQVTNIVKVIRDEALSCTHCMVFSECPPPQGQYSSGLYALDTHLHLELLRNGAQVYRYYPTMLQHIHGKRKYTKTESVQLAKRLCEAIGLEFSTKWSHDECEAVLYLFAGLASVGLLEEKAREIAPGLFDDKSVRL